MTTTNTTQENSSAKEENQLRLKISAAVNEQAKAQGLNHEGVKYEIDDTMVTVQFNGCGVSIGKIINSDADLEFLAQCSVQRAKEWMDCIAKHGPDYFKAK